MHAPPPIEQSDAMLAEVAGMDLRAARHVHECLLSTDKPAEVAQLSQAYGRLSRSTRQTLALLARLKADRARAQREADRHETWLESRTSSLDWETQAVKERAADLHDAVGGVISKAAKGDRTRHTDLVHRFDREMDDWVERPDFLDADFDTLVLRACALLGLPEDLAKRWDELPAPTFFPDPAPRVRTAAPPHDDEAPTAFDDADDDSADPADTPAPLADTG